MIFAQAALNSVPDSYAKWFFVCLFVVLSVAAMIIGIVKTLQPPKPHRLNDDPPIEVRKAPKRYNHDLFVSQHDDVNRRLNGHDKEIEQLWSTLRAEDAETRRQMAESFLSIQRALGRIEGKLEDGRSN